MDAIQSMSQGTFYFTRVRAGARSMTMAICLVISAFPASAESGALLFGRDHRAHAVSVDAAQEPATRRQMQLLENCEMASAAPAAMPLVGSEGATIDPRLQAPAAIVILEGLRPGQTPKALHTAVIGQFKNLPASIPGETGVLPGNRYSLAVSFVAPERTELRLKKGDFLLLHADGQVFRYELPAFSVPRGGVLRTFAGADDRLYFDANLKHPLHAGSCKKRTK